MTRMFAVVLLAAGLLVGEATPGVARAQGPGELALRGAYFPESISAAPNGTLYVSSIASGEIVRFAPGSSASERFVGPDVNVNTAGVMVDPLRGVLWACAVDLSPVDPTASELRAFDLRTGDLVASYVMPDGGVCADIVLAWGDVYVTDTGGGRIDRLATDRFWRADGGTLVEWVSDPRFVGAPLGINGIAFNGLLGLFTTNYTTGKLFGVRIGLDGSPQQVREIALDSPMVTPDGLRWRGGFLYVAENANGLARINPRTGERALVDRSLDQPSSLVFVEDDMWITEGQILRLVTGDPNLNFPFKVVRRPAP
jgi:sugar lactone lactonase YvrE